MQNSPSYILILEDNEAFAAALADLLNQTLPDHRVLVARTLEEAQTLAGEFLFELFLVDVNLPDGTGFEFLCDIRTVQPDARVLIMTAAPLPEYREQAAKLGVIRFLEKPFNLGVVANYVKSLLTEPQVQADSFHGTLRHLSSTDIVQIKCMGGATSALEFFGPDEKSGIVYFERGKIIHVEAGCLEGVEAFISILSWDGGRFNEIDETIAPKRTIFLDWQTLLMDSVRAMDEMRDASKLQNSMG